MRAMSPPLRVMLLAALRYLLISPTPFRRRLFRHASAAADISL